MSALRLASFRVQDRSLFGAVKDEGIVDLSKRLGGRYGTMIELILGGAPALAEARKAAEDGADYRRVLSIVKVCQGPGGAVLGRVRDAEEFS